MKFFIDIGHPAHVHYFKHFIFELEKDGHVFLITARNKEVTHELLKSNKIPFISRGKGSNSFFGKGIYLIKTIRQFVKLNKKYKADIFLSFVSPYAAQTAWLFGKPHIVLDDTEHSTFARRLYLFFSNVVITPQSFKVNLGAKQKRVNSFTELLYLHPSHYKSQLPYNLLNISSNTKYVVLRFVAWKAYHDRGQTGVSKSKKLELIRFFEKRDYKVFISSEDKLENELKEYSLNIPAERIHDVLQHASFFVGEGATMASECVILGIPSIYVNSLNTGYLSEQEENYGLLNLRNSKNLISKVEKRLVEYTKELAIINSKQLIQDKVDYTSFLVKYVKDFQLTSADSKKKRMKRFGVFLLIYAIIVSAAYLIPFNQEFSLNNYQVGRLRADHFMHLIVFIPLPILIVPFFRKKKNYLLKTLIISIIISGLFESTHYIVPYRSFTLIDLSFNIIAVVLGTILISLFRRKTR